MLPHAWLGSSSSYPSPSSLILAPPHSSHIPRTRHPTSSQPPPPSHCSPICPPPPLKAAAEFPLHSTRGQSPRFYTRLPPSRSGPKARGGGGGGVLEEVVQRGAMGGGGGWDGRLGGGLGGAIWGGEGGGAEGGGQAPPTSLCPQCNHTITINKPKPKLKLGKLVAKPAPPPPPPRQGARIAKPAPRNPKPAAKPGPQRQVAQNRVWHLNGGRRQPGA